MPPRKCESENDVFPRVRKIYTRNEREREREGTRLCFRLVLGVCLAGNNHNAIMKEDWNVSKNIGRAENSPFFSN